MRVQLFATCLGDQLFPDAVADAESPLQGAGCEVVFPHGQTCCAQPAFNTSKSRGVRHGSAEVLARLARGEDVDASEYTFRTSTQIETAAPALDWLNKGVFISVGARQPGAVIYETYLVG